jgi:ribosome maturation factor RimP
VSNTRRDAVRDQIEARLGDPLRALGLDVEAVEITPAGRRRVLRVAVDSDGGVSLDEVAAATAVINRVLDESDVMGEQPYTLEVSSRGVDRPLTLPRHWRRNAGRLVEVSYADGTSVTGRITEAGDEAATLEIGGDRRPVAYAEVKKARVRVEFNRHPGDNGNGESDRGESNGGEHDRGDDGDWEEGRWTST